MFEKIDTTKMTEGEKGFMQQVASGVKEEITAAVKGLATAEQMQELRKETSEQLASVKASVETANESKGVKTIADEMREQLKEFTTNGKLDVQMMKNARKSVSFDVKAAGATTVAGNVTGANLGTEVLPEIDRFPRAYSPIRDIATVGAVSAPTLIIAEFASKEGGAEWVPEGGLKPLLDAELSQRTITAGKVAVRYKVSEELLEDFPAFEAELRAEAIDSVGMKESEGVLNGNGTGGQITGVSAEMPAYIASGHVVDNANYFDALYAAMVQIASNSEYNYEANAVLINSADYATMMSTKGSNGVPLWSEYERFFDGVRFIRVSSNVLPQGTFIAGDFSKLNILDRTPLHVEIGWENDDFSNNLVTVVVEKRLMAFIKNQHKYAFLKDTFANVLSKITAE